MKIITLVSVIIVIVEVSSALKLNITAKCVDNQAKFCTVSNLTTSYDDPLIIVDSSAPQLSALIIRNSVITRLPKEIFVQAPNLREFFMHQCGLNRIEIEDFVHATLLKKLLLQNNRLSELSENIFSAATRELQELHLGNNHIHLVHGKAFASLDQLIYLDLHQNSLQELPPGLFNDLMNLEHIDMSSNDLDKIDSETFAQNFRLRTVLLGDNKFTVFESNSLEHLTHLHLLDLSYSSLDELRLSSVDTLLVQNSELKRCVIKQSAIKVQASNNILEHISIGDLLTIKELDLHNNMFTNLEDFVGMLNLQKLDVSKNQLKTLRTSNAPLYIPLPSLMFLNLASNQLQNLSADNFLLLPKLNHLDLAYNHLLNLELNTFEPLLRLEKLYIEGNRLRRLNYQKLVHTHLHLKEVGMFSNDWELPYMRAMVRYFKETGIQLPVRFNPKEALEMHSTTEHHSGREYSHHRYASTEFMPQLESEEVGHSPDLSGVGGIHPYWTRRDVYALITLLVVLSILILQFYRILQEENWLDACRSRRSINSIAHTGAGAGGGSRNRPRRLEEDDSEV